MRNFTKEEGYYWGGAECFSNGEQPMIGEVELGTNYLATIIAGGSGVVLIVTDEDDYYTEYYKDMSNPTKAEAKATAEKIEQTLLSTEELYEEYATAHDYITDTFPELTWEF